MHNVLKVNWMHAWQFHERLFQFNFILISILHIQCLVDLCYTASPPNFCFALMISWYIRCYVVQWCILVDAGPLSGVHLLQIQIFVKEWRCKPYSFYGFSLLETASMLFLFTANSRRWKLLLSCFWICLHGTASPR